MNGIKNNIVLAVRPNLLVAVTYLQVICFAVLYAIWGLPETILIRHICLIIGALGSFFIFFLYRKQFNKSGVVSILLLIGLFFWATVHLIYFGKNPDLQYLEFVTIWKRVLIGAIFAFGLGMSLFLIGEIDYGGSTKDLVLKHSLHTLFYVGILAPTLIYLFKYILMNKANQWSITIPEYWMLYYESAPFYLPKTYYVCFCLPTLGFALGQLIGAFKYHQIYRWSNLLYLTIIAVIFFVFYSENIKNGIAYSAILIFCFLAWCLLVNLRQYWFSRLIAAFFLLVVCGGLMLMHVHKNNSWKTLFFDTKIALDTSKYSHWKYYGARGYPFNELDIKVSVTNYDRVAWAKVGSQLILQNPFGYGLIERSFGWLAKEKWPDSNLNQSHSGWIDLTLGIGIPGVLLIWASIILTIRRLFSMNLNKKIPLVYPEALIFSLLGIFLMWCTTEISQKVYFDALIFWICMSSGFTIAFFIPRNCFRPSLQ